jgi:hypothetical protein
MLWGCSPPPHEPILPPASGSQRRRCVGGCLRAGIRIDGGAGSRAGAKCGRVYPLPDFPARVAGPVLCAGGVGGGAGDPVLSGAIPFQSLVSGGTADAAGAVSGRPDSIWQFGGSARHEPVGGRRRPSTCSRFAAGEPHFLGVVRRGSARRADYRRPQFGLGSGPISRMRLPPLRSSLAGKWKVSSGLPLREALWT